MYLGAERNTLSIQTGFDLVNAAVACAILESISGLEPSSAIIEPRYLKLVTISSFSCFCINDSCLKCVPDKKGPIYSVMWNCKSTEFCVVYGCILLPATGLSVVSVFLRGAAGTIHHVLLGLWVYVVSVTVLSCPDNGGQVFVNYLMLVLCGGHFS